MMQGLRRIFDSFRGGGEFSITVPSMDGALRPNSAIEEADVIARAPSPDTVLIHGDRVLFSSGSSVYAINGDAVDVIFTGASPISAMATGGDMLALGFADGGIRLIGGESDGKAFLPSEAFPINCPTAMAFASDGRLVIANGSSQHDPEHWKNDLMDMNAKGSVWSLDLGTGKAERLADRLAFPNGVLPTADGSVIVSEAWRYRLMRIGAGRAPEPVLSDLPAYPARLSTAGSSTGAWLALFAPRRRLVEHVLRETEYRRRMVATIPPDYWISPSLRPMSSFLEPLQGGTLKKLARLKPWAPSRSYGLIVRLDGEFQPVESFHSRADGTRHGITSCIERDGRLLAASKGGDVVVSIPLGVR